LMIFDTARTLGILNILGTSWCFWNFSNFGHGTYFGNFENYVIITYKWQKPRMETQNF